LKGTFSISWVFFTANNGVRIIHDYRIFMELFISV